MSNPWMFYTLTFVAALGLATGVTPLVIWAGRAWGLMDEPDARKVHIRPVPRSGGIAIAAATLFVALVMLIVVHVRSGVVPPELLRQIVTVAAAAGFVFLVGLIDDVRGVTPRFKALALIAASLAVCGSGATIDTLYVANQPWLELGWAAWPVTVLWIVGMGIAINFIDGIDGLAGGLVLLAGAVLAAFGIAAGNPAVAVVPLALAGALGGFLIYNAHPARVFMGDSGSFFIGFVIAAAMVLANPVLGTMEAVLIPGLALSVPIVDTALTLFRRRYQQRRSIFAAERGHIHHHLLDQGLTQRQAVVCLYGVSILAVGVGLLAWSSSGWQTAGALSLVVPLLWGAFRLAGSVRTREMVDAVRRKRELDRVARRFEEAFHELQMEFRRVTDFSSWWQTVCRAAEALEFAHVELPLVGRDGNEQTLTWKPAEDVEPGVACLTATVPVAQRRGRQPLEANVSVVATRSVESAGDRLSLFTRLMSDHAVADLPSTNGHRTARPTSRREQLAAIAGWDKIKPLAVVHKGRHPDPNGLQRTGPLAGKRIAIVHDFLYVYAGAEKVVEQMIELFPEADLFALFDFVPEDQRGFLRGKRVKTSFIQKMPLARRKHRGYLPLMPLAIEQFDLSGYDIVLSSSYLAAKGVITGPDQLHVCYCHSPARYAWDLQHQYLDQKRIGFGPKGMAARAILHYIRNWDARSALGVDLFIANSRFVAQRIQKLYRRDAEVIHPPVDTDFFTPDTEEVIASGGGGKADFYLTASRLVPYKRIDLVVDAFNRMPDRRLVVVGDGPEYARIAELAGPNVTLAGYQTDEQLRRYMRLAKAFVFAAEEDFGIVPVEALACGTPVIAYGHGGARETVTDGVTGLFFDRQTPDAIADAVARFEAGAVTGERAPDMTAFSPTRFRREVLAAVETAWRKTRFNPKTDNADSTTAAGQPVPVTPPADTAEPVTAEVPQPK